MEFIKARARGNQPGRALQERGNTDESCRNLYRGSVTMGAPLGWVGSELEALSFVQVIYIEPLFLQRTLCTQQLLAAELGKYRERHANQRTFGLQHTCHLGITIWATHESNTYRSSIVRSALKLRSTADTPGISAINSPSVEHIQLTRRRTHQQPSPRP